MLGREGLKERESETQRETLGWEKERQAQRIGKNHTEKAFVSVRAYASKRESGGGGGTKRERYRKERPWFAKAFRPKVT